MSTMTFLPRRNHILVSGLVIVAFLFGAFTGNDGKGWNNPFTQFSSPTLSSQTITLPTCPSQCWEDPYVKPGMILWSTDPRKTQYVPFPPSLGQLGKMRTRELDGGGTAYWGNDTEARELAVPAFTMGVKERDEEFVGFARGKIALLVGSSHDRANVVTFCTAVGGKMHSWGSHVAGICYVDWLDLTLISWFLFGMVDDDKADWFVVNEARPLTFENRIKDIMLPLMAEKDLQDMQPDMIIFSSLFWDESFLWRHGQQVGHYTTDESDGEFGLFYEEIKWHRSRVLEFINLMREMYGPDTPMMYRTRQHRAKNRWGGTLKIAQLEQSNRAITREMGVRWFTWGSKLEGYLKYGDNDQHFDYGPATYLFGDMFMFYLHQATVPGCWACQQHLDIGFDT